MPPWETYETLFQACEALLGGRAQKWALHAEKEKRTEVGSQAARAPKLGIGEQPAKCPAQRLLEPVQPPSPSGRSLSMMA